MFERFTERARHVVVLAQEESRALRHDYIGTEHILLGLLREEEGLAARSLDSLGITVEGVREKVVRLVGQGSEDRGAGSIPFTQRAKKVLETALHESMLLGHDYIGTEHILLGVAADSEGVGARVLAELDVDLDGVRSSVMQMLSGPHVRESKQHMREGPLGRPQRIVRRGRSTPEGWHQGLGPLMSQVELDIRQRLGREADVGDLLLVIASLPDTLAAGALRELGIEPDKLAGVIDRLRSEQAEAEKPVSPDVIEEIRRRLGIPGSPGPEAS